MPYVEIIAAISAPTGPMIIFVRLWVLSSFGRFPKALTVSQKEQTRRYTASIAEYEKGEGQIAHRCLVKSRDRAVLRASVAFRHPYTDALSTKEPG